MTTDFRALCAELLADYEQNRFRVELAAQARAALAEPEPEGPTPQVADGEVAELVRWLQENAKDEREMSNGENPASLNLDRAADLLERLRPPQPVPVSERLPGPEDCDEHGRCWWLTLDWAGTALWTQPSTPTHWLPAHALPVLSSGEVAP